MKMSKTSRFAIMAVCALAAAGAASSCSGDDYWVDFADWRNTNIAWLNEQIATGKYEKVTPVWNDSLHVWMQWHNDTMLTKDNLRPYYTSQVDVCYKGMFYDGVGFDSSYLNTDSIASFLPKDVITGWTIALERMHVGDSVTVLIPYEVGYGDTGFGAIPPYSTLQFSMALRNISAYEVRP